MIDSQDPNLNVSLRWYVQDQERVIGLLAFLDTTLPADQHDAFLALLTSPLAEERKALLETATLQADEVGLDAVKVATDTIAGKDKVAKA